MFLGHCSYPNSLVTFSIAALAHPQATWVAVYPALFMWHIWASRCQPALTIVEITSYKKIYAVKKESFYFAVNCIQNVDGFVPKKLRKNIRIIDKIIIVYCLMHTGRFNDIFKKQSAQEFHQFPRFFSSFLSFCCRRIEKSERQKWAELRVVAMALKCSDAFSTLSILTATD